MDLFYLVLIFLSVVGMALVIISVLPRNSENEGGGKPATIDINTKIRDIGLTIDEADNVISELNDVSHTVLKEIDNKYQELLFLYNLIEDKKKALTQLDNSALSEVNLGEKPDFQNTPTMSEKLSVVKNMVPSGVNPFYDKRAKSNSLGDLSSKINKNPKLPEILKLRDDGLEVPEIAKKLGLGQGEVELIISLNNNASKNSNTSKISGNGR